MVVLYPRPGSTQSCWLTKIQGGLFQTHEEFGERIYTEGRQKSRGALCTHSNRGLEGNPLTSKLKTKCLGGCQHTQPGRQVTKRGVSEYSSYSCFQMYRSEGGLGIFV